VNVYPDTDDPTIIRYLTYFGVFVALIAVGLYSIANTIG
jgi:hypothetical protein